MRWLMLSILFFYIVTILAVVAQKQKTKFDDLLVSIKRQKYIAYLFRCFYLQAKFLYFRSI
jgi:miniconductance mechanosensitive channel